MPINLIIQQPVLGAAWVAAILIAIGIHEFAHAAMARRLGDSTARDLGRLTLNPLAHVDALGFVMLLFLGFGWGKPVPFNASNLQNRRWGPSFIALAGPSANILGVVLSGLALAAVERLALLPMNNLLVFFLFFIFQINFILLIFNIIPIPPLDGSKVLLSLLDHPRYDNFRFFLETRGPLLLIILIVLDGLSGGMILGRMFQSVFQWTAGLF